MERFKTHGVFGWNELLTNDVESAKEFYAEVFGWEFDDMDMGDGGVYTVISAGQDEIGGIMTLPPNVPKDVPPHWGAYVTVNDADRAAAAAERMGGTVLVPPTDVPGVGRFTVFQDPQGAVISAMKYKEM